jgi:hypothetical protein
MSATTSTPPSGLASTTASVADSYKATDTAIVDVQHCRNVATATNTVTPPISHPIDPDAPSLLTLPGEVRNAIYEILFVSSQPIKISSDQARGRSYSSGNAGPHTNLLKSCRQIRYEASGILYAQNTFCLELPWSTEVLCCMTWAMEWLDTIGAQSFLVATVQVDIDIFFHGVGDLEILPVLKRVWKPDYRNMNVCFVANPKKRYSTMSCLFRDRTRTEAVQTVDLNKTLNGLILDSSNYLKKYHSVMGILDSVQLSRNGPWAYIDYHQTHKRWGNWMSRDRIRVDNNGETHVDPLPRPLGIMQIMGVDNIQSEIYDMIHPPSTKRIFNLTRKTTSINIQGLFAVNMRLRKDIISHLKNKPTTICMTSTTPRNNFQTELATYKVVKLLGRCHVFHLRYDLPRDSSMNETRFDGFALLSAVANQFLSAPSVKLEVSHACLPLPGYGPTKVFVIYPDKLVDAVLLFVYRILDAHPTRSQLACPSIWVNPLGEVMEAEWDSDLRFESFANVDSQDTQGVIRNRLAEVLNRFCEQLDEGFQAPENSLIQVVRSIEMSNRGLYPERDRKRRI